MDINPVVLSIPIYFLLIGIELLIQQFSRTKFYRLNDAVTNISCGITQQLTGVFFKIFSVGIYQYLYENFTLALIPSNILTIVLLFILVDLAYYWAHRMSHEINLFWGAHVVHHQSEDYNLSVALRQSSFQVIWTSFFYLPLALAGFNTIDFVLVSALSTVYQFWIHTPTIRRMGILEYVINTPSHHRVHHGRDPKYIDKNHAGVFIIWDKMFGTFQREEETPTYGITRPLRSWNPIWANFEHYTFMWNEMKAIPGFANKFRYILNKPGWYPKEMGGYKPALPVDRDSHEKFKTHSPSVINFYVLFQYLIALLATALFLFNIGQFSINENMLVTTLIVITIVNCGALFELKPWVYGAEAFRILIYSGILLFLSYFNSWDLLLFLLGASYLVVSMTWMYFLNQIRRELANA